MRQLKYHEQRLLRKVDFLEWKSDDTLREGKILRRYNVTDREDYRKYSKMVGYASRFAHRLAKRAPTDPTRLELTTQLLGKLYALGLISTRDSLAQAQKLTVSAFCRRRLPVVMVRLKMCETLGQAVRYVQQGNVRVGPHVVSDDAFLVTRSMDDFVTWVDGSKVQRQVKTYNDELDDYDLLGE